MALDHYVSQVHLRKFYSPDLRERMYAIRKSDQKRFTPDSKSVCRIDEGSTNPYLSEARAVEDFLKLIEPNYNGALRAIDSGPLAPDDIFAIAGFVAYVSSCSPASLRIYAGPLEELAKDHAIVAANIENFPPPPVELGSGTLVEFLESGVIRAVIDPKFIQANGISSIVRRAAVFGNSTWEILINDDPGSPFFTSDYPVCIEATRDPRVLSRLVPLSPRVAVRIVPEVSRIDEDLDLSFRKLRYMKRRVSKQEVMEVNRLIVRCAEALVFYSSDQPWIPGFVQKNSRYRIETNIVRIPQPDGDLIWHRQEVVEHKHGGIRT